MDINRVFIRFECGYTTRTIEREFKGYEAKQKAQEIIEEAMNKVLDLVDDEYQYPTVGG